MKSVPILTATLVASCLSSSAAPNPPAADTIYFGGPVLTMDDANPQAEAVAVADGRILAVGKRDAVNAHQVESTTLFDLDGQALLPGFVDSHGHVAFGGVQAVSANLLPPPDGDGHSVERIIEILKTWHAENTEIAEALNLIIGFGYDQAQLAESRHPTRDDLDQISTEVPVFIIHQSGHFGVANSKLLAAVGYDASTPDPAGGIIRRQPDGTPNGVLEEAAHFQVLGAALSGIDAVGMQELIKAGAGLWASYGYTTGQEGRANPDVTEGFKMAGAPAHRHRDLPGRAD